MKELERSRMILKSLSRADLEALCNLARLPDLGNNKNVMVSQLLLVLTEVGAEDRVFASRTRR